MEVPSKITQNVPASWIPLLLLCRLPPAQPQQDLAVLVKHNDRDRWTSGEFQMCELRIHLGLSGLYLHEVRGQGGVPAGGGQPHPNDRHGLSTFLSLGLTAQLPVLKAASVLH